MSEKGLMDYSKGEVIDTSSLMPEYLRSRLWEGISKNLFNRFLTKKKFEEVFGYIGQTSPTLSNRIEEENDYLQKNQIQEVINVGDTFLTFQKFLEAMEDSGVDLESFSEWGKVLQFNFAPPISIDKLINYQNYYWTDQTTSPNYIVIKNQKSRAEASYEELKKTTFSGVQERKSGTLISSEPDGFFIVYDSTQNTYTSVVKDGGSLVNIETGSVTSIGSTHEYVRLDFDMSLSGPNTLEVSGQFFQTLQEGAILSLYFSIGSFQELVEVESVSYDDVNDKTHIKLRNSPAYVYGGKVSLHPLVYSAFWENYYFQDPKRVKDVPYIKVYDIGLPVWCNRRLVGSSTNGTVASTGSNEITQPHDPVFDTMDPSVTYGIRILSGPNRGDYRIQSFAHTPGLESSFIVEGAEFFQDYQISFEIYVVNDLDSQFPVPQEYDFYHDKTQDVLLQRESGVWVPKIYGFSLLKEEKLSTFVPDTNDWIESNKWVHKNQINNFSGKRQALQPIIEYEDYVELSEFSKFTYRWAYRATSSEGYIETDVEPSLLEIQPIQIPNDNSRPVFLNSGNKIVIPEKFGNLTPYLKPGDKINLVGFTNNDGQYTIEDIEFVEYEQGSRWNTVITIASLFLAVGDESSFIYEADGGGTIYPHLTALGDIYDPAANHWAFLGIGNITPTSVEPEINPMLLGPSVSQGISVSDLNHQYLTKIGLYWQEFNPLASYSGAKIELDSSLHDLCLAEDWQEGDIRVYIDGRRMYGKFYELRSNGYISGIIFDNDITIDEETVVRIELGEYWSDDIGRRAVTVIDPYGNTDTYNLSRYKKIEQTLSGVNEYPFFKLYDIHGNQLDDCNPIFWFKENGDFTLNTILNRRIEYNRNPKDLVFEHGLVDENDKLICYLDLRDSTIKSIWRRGNNYEQSVPKKVGDYWDIPNNWKFNIAHDLRKSLSLSEVFRHFKTITMSQQSKKYSAELPSEDFFHAVKNPNMGVGGTIKEHNGRLDLLASAILSKNTSVPKAIEFVAEAYDNIVYDIIIAYLKNLPSFIDSSIDEVFEDLKEKIESDVRLDRIFGDSFSSVGDVGIKNWVSTSAMLRMTDPSVPQVFKDVDGAWTIKRHDGTYSRIVITPTHKANFYALLTQNTQRVSSTADSFPSPSNYNEGDYLIRGVIETKDIYLYRLQSGVWVEIDVVEKLAKALYLIEKNLYDAAILNQPLKYFYDLNKTTSNPKFAKKERDEFFSRVGEGTLTNADFDPTNPFTWNYGFTDIQSHPLTGGLWPRNKSSWQALYEDVYGTAFPHREPWVLQGYSEEPAWWKDTYLNTDPNVNRYWKDEMWDNIFDGVVPAGEVLPDGVNISSQSPGETQVFQYVPVNVTSSVINGIEPDGLAPPYWDGSLSPDSRFKPLYDKSLGDHIASPNANYEFGKGAPSEWEWRNSSDYLYFLLKSAFQLDPIEFYSRNYGDDYVSVDCLLVNKDTENVNPHNRTVFHGEYRTNGDLYKSQGLQQWIVNYNRYNEVDEYKRLWTGWEMFPSYVFNSLINDTTLDVFGDKIDIVNRDYKVFIDKKLRSESNIFSAITWAVSKKAPLTERDDYGTKNWVFRAKVHSPEKIKKVEYYHPQNYKVRLVGTNRFTTGSYSITDVPLEPPRGFWRAIYSSPIGLGDTVAVSSGQYESTIIFDGSITNTVSITFNGATTVEELIDIINAQLTDGFVDLENGFLVIKSNTTSTTSTVSVTTDTLFSSIFSGFTSSTGNTGYVFKKSFVLQGNLLEHFRVQDQITITGSSNYNGTYTVDYVEYSPVTNNTIIRVLETVNVPDDTVDGVVIPSNVITIPWETGQEVYLDTDGVLPEPLSRDKPYYVFKINDTDFQLAETEELALTGTILNFSTIGSGNFWAGKVLTTFDPLSEVDYGFRRHDVDKRFVLDLFDGQSVTRVQSLIDIIFGYEALLADRGIVSVPQDLSNKSEKDKGRNNEWLLELEEFISWLDMLVRRAEEKPARITATVDVSSSSFTNPSGKFLSTGQKIRLRSQEGKGSLPDELSSPFNSFVPYYAIVSNSGDIQIAYTEQNAKSGKHIRFSTGAGEIVIEIFREDRVLPEKTMNPYRRHFVISHERGLPEKLDRSNMFEKNHVFDIHSNYIDLSDILFFRHDTETNVLLTENSKLEIGGAVYSIFEVTHICRFNHYTTGKKVIYDPFLGLKTPRLFLSYLRPVDSFGRINVGGFVINEDSLINNIEKSIQDIRDYYDVYSSIRGGPTNEVSRKSIGYDGPKEYMINLNIDSKSQFIFWKGFIQNKGTDKSLNAFMGHKLLRGVDIDDFWAYRVCSFGDGKQKFYPEVKLKTDDVVRQELRLEFLPPTGAPIGRGYVPIRLSDHTRWHDLPDVVEELRPYNGYFFDVDVTETIENAENFIDFSEISSLTSNKILRLSKPAYAAKITYEVGGQKLLATEGLDYRFLNAFTIEFLTQDVDNWQNVQVAGITYSYDSTNVFKLIDKKESVVTNIPIWNPALGQENPIGNYPIDWKVDNDPAKYTDDLNPDRISKKHWDEKQVGKVWLDTTLKGYLPYYDKHIYNTQDERSAIWGRLAEYGKIELYRWTESELSPEEYILQSERDLKDNKPLEEALTGVPRAVVYKNENGSWKEEKTYSSTFPIAGISQTDMVNFSEGDLLEVYVNGKFLSTTEYKTIGASSAYQNFIAFLSLSQIGPNSMITVIRRAVDPTEEELKSGTYTKIYPHVKVEHIERLSGQKKYKYYFWVSSDRSHKLLNGTSLTLLDATRELETINGPYAIIDGFRTEGEGYGVLFGATYDPDDNNLPMRFSQLIVKGLASTVKNNSDYVLRLRKDFTLRDEIGKNLSKSNKHEDWKLIRRKQPSKIDFVLWKKLVESATGFLSIDEDFNIDKNHPLPSNERVRYDTLVEKAATRIGLGDGQVLLDTSELRPLLEEILFDPNKEWSVNDIEEFYESYDLSTPEGYVEMLRAIYNNFTAKEVNGIFFEVLERSVAARKRHPDIFKTSWIAVNVSNGEPLLEGDIIEIESVEASTSDSCPV